MLGGRIRSKKYSQGNFIQATRVVRNDVQPCDGGADDAARLAAQHEDEDQRLPLLPRSPMSKLCSRPPNR